MKFADLKLSWIST